MRALTAWTGALLWMGVLSGAAEQAVPRLVPALHRRHAMDLEVSGLAGGRTGYLSYAQLASLPQVAVDVEDDENLPHAASVPVHIEGVPLTVLREALNIPAAEDVIAARCTDLYQAHYPAEYLAAHHPILALKIDGQSPAAWAAAHHAYDPGPYFITHEHFRPEFQVLSHRDEAQIPTNVVRLNFTDSAHAFGPITPPKLESGASTASEAVAQGFTIARQNCLRCHFAGDAGGAKSGRDWQILSLWARQKPDYFTGYVHNPKDKDPKSQMPAFPEYDAATLNALRAYFQAFPK